MYYPYLRSKQNEMLALREIAQSTTIHYSHIMPIIEPVRELSSLDKTIEAMEKAAIPYAIILNSNGYNAEDVYIWLAKDNSQHYSPAFLCDYSIQFVQDFIKLRKDNNLTQAKMAENANMIREQIARIENHLSSPQINTLIKALEPLGYTIAIVKIEK